MLLFMSVARPEHVRSTLYLLYGRGTLGIIVMLSTIGSLSVFMVASHDLIAPKLNFPPPQQTFVIFTGMISFSDLFFT